MLGTQHSALKFDRAVIGCLEGQRLEQGRQNSLCLGQPEGHSQTNTGSGTERHVGVSVLAAIETTIHETIWVEHIWSIPILFVAMQCVDRDQDHGAALHVLALSVGADYTLMAWAPTIAWLFAGRIISGIMGASWAAANSCIADSIPRERRGAAFGMLGGAGAAGFVLGPAIGGVIGQFGDRLPFVAAAVMCLGGVVFGLAVFKETLSPERRRSFDPFRANPFGSIVRMARIPLVIGCLTAIFFMQLASQSQLSVWAYYGALKFGWTPIVIGLTVTFFGVLLGVTQGLLSGKSIARFGPVPTATYSLMFAVPSFLILAFAPRTWVVLAGMVVGAIPGMCFPAMQQLMTERVDDDAQGELQGAIASAISLTAIVGPPVMTGVFGAYADGQGVFFPGAPFVVAALLMVVAVIVLASTLRRHAHSVSR